MGVSSQQDESQTTRLIIEQARVLEMDMLQRRQHVTQHTSNARGIPFLYLMASMETIMHNMVDKLLSS